MAPALQVEGLSKTFGGLKAVQDLTFDVEEGAILGLIGPNGAGKSTAFNLISGSQKPTSGSVRLAGRDITGLPPDRVVRHGLARTFQSASVYSGATVKENLFRGAISNIDTAFPGQLFRTGGYRRRLAEIDKEIEKVLEVSGLAPYRDRLAGELAYGHQKRLGVAIGLATRPSVLLLDEPAAGLNQEESAELGRLLKTLRQEYGLTLLFVEHHMALVMEVCERIVVLVQGCKIAEGTPEEIRNNPQVVEAYLGAPDYAYA
ncbi:ABC transporter ATP-binding protein [Afifella sp. IM 167]|uniref:ABC transporter ATP-binding protein n=1 Tax=Afifella sp. IM 167 TaxID=2033586 RepID=UPI001CCCC4A1|nr:ABC transporter ATP-binding protein [Afifella sp. IM 167]MBZ8132383.1 ABC transporter ATP-binding protein [Afifella sp. IM 167]